MKKVILLLPIVAVIVLSAFGLIEDSPLKQLVNRIHQQTISNHQEKLYLHFDRPIYHAGDDAWFKAYLLNAANHKKEKTEKLMYIELINPNGKVVDKKIFKVNEGNCDGVFHLNADLLSGRYLIVAYTNWMRNVGSEFFFKQQITILNEDEPLFDSLNDTANSSDSITNVKSSSAHAVDKGEISPSLNLRFFPEGGELIAGLTTLVAFEGLNQAGKPMDFNGYIIDNDGKKHAFIKPLIKGKGYFSLKPQTGKTYQAVVLGNKGEELSYALPLVRSQGLSMNVSNNFASEIIEVKVMAQLAETHPIVYLIGMQNGSVKVALQGMINGRSLTFTIPKDKFRTGVVQFTVLDEDQVPRCERLTFVNHHDNLKIDLQVSDAEPGKRDLVTLNLKVSDKDGEAVEGDFSLAISDVDLIPDSMYQHYSMVDYVNLISDIPNVSDGVPELLNPERTSHNNLELIMLTNGWRRFNWKACLLDSVAEPEYAMEEGMYVNGIVKRRKSDKPVSKGVEVTMITQGDIMDFYRVKTDDKGQFNFPLFDFNDTVDVVVQTRNKLSYKSDFAVELQSNLSFQPVDKGARERMGVGEDIPTTFFKSDAVGIDATAIDRSGLVRRTNERLTDLGLADTTDVFIQEVEIVSKREKTPKEEMNDFFGSANETIGQKQVEAIAKNTPWHSGLIDLLFDAIPDLQLTVVSTEELIRDNVLKDGNFSRDIANADGTDVVNVNPTIAYREYIQFVLKGKGLHKFYLFIDGKFIGSTDRNGYLRSLVPPIEMADLIAMDPTTVQSIEFRHDLKNHPVHFSMSTGAVLDGDPYSLPPAMLAIYTKDGKGMYSKQDKKGVGNLRLFGYTREREFYSPVYDGFTDESISFDKRATLHWEPNLRTDSLGQASLQFYNSDVAESIRVDVAGISNNSLPGAKRQIFGKAKNSQLNKTDNKPKTNIVGLKRGVSSNDFTAQQWQRYLLQYAHDSLWIGIVLDHKGAVLPFADIAVKGTDIGTSANASGIFALDKSKVTNNDLLLISNAGKAYSELSLQQIINNSMQAICMPIDLRLTDLKARDVMKDVYAVLSKKRQVKQQAFQFVYREMVKKDENLYALSDFSLNLEQNFLRSAKVPHVSQIEQGRIFKSDDYGQVIKWKPLATITDEVVQLKNPLSSPMPFIDKRYQQSFTYEITGLCTYRGTEVIIINFKQITGSYHNFFDGRLLIDSQNKHILHCEWQASEAAKDFQVSDNYIKTGHQSGLLTFKSNINQCSFRFNGEHTILKHQYEQVSLYMDKQEISYVRELSLCNPIINNKQLVKESLSDRLKQRSLINKVSYKPWYWRIGSVLLPDFYMMDQVKYLHEVEFY